MKYLRKPSFIFPLQGHIFSFDISFGELKQVSGIHQKSPQKALGLKGAGFRRIAVVLVSLIFESSIKTDTLESVIRFITLYFHVSVVWGLHLYICVSV